MQLGDRTLGDARGEPSDPTLERTAGAPGAGPRSAAPLPPGARVGRYVVLHELGAGAMGSVYAAYDRELDRKIALKLVRVDDDRAADQRRTRLLREAQAMARITHPNVVSVHDVGTHDDQVYVAMEFIHGVTVKVWCEREPRPWSEVVDVFRDAGRGLSAAHEQGLVHRDFKPENVMIADRTRRVVVLDFGLARGEQRGERAADGAAVEPGSTPLLSTEITHAGHLAGTPAYMSPEQFAGAEVGPASDQFGFCVSLWEALHGERPFDGSSAAALAFSVAQGKLRTPDARRGVPAWVRRAVARGLAPDPAQRWPSMPALLAALAPAQTRPRRLGGRGMLLGAGLAGGLAATLWVARRPDLCTGAREQLVGVWNEDRRRQATEHAAELQLPWLARGFQVSVATLDDYADRWATAHEDACEATARRGEQSDAVLDLRMACLGRARMELAAVADRSLTVDAAQAVRVHELGAALPPLEHCADVAALLEGQDPPHDPAVATRSDAIRRELAAARAGVLMHQTALSDTLPNLREEVMAIDDPGLQAEWLAVLGAAQSTAGRPQAARESLDEALALSLGARRWELAVGVSSELTELVGRELDQPGEAMIYARTAQGLSDSAGVGEAARRKTRLALATALEARGDYEDALETAGAVLDTTPPELEGERVQVLSRVARLLTTRDQLAEAEAPAPPRTPSPRPGRG